MKYKLMMPKKKKRYKRENFLPYVPCTHIAVEGKTQLKIPYLTSRVHGLFSTLMEVEGNFLSKKTKALKKSLSFEREEMAFTKKGGKKKFSQRSFHLVSLENGMN